MHGGVLGNILCYVVVCLPVIGFGPISDIHCEVVAIVGLKKIVSRE